MWDRRTLTGIRNSLIAVRNQGVVARSGKTHHTIAERSGNLAELFAQDCEATLIQF
jgi:hypothetical protein